MLSKLPTKTRMSFLLLLLLSTRNLILSTNITALNWLPSVHSNFAFCYFHIGSSSHCEEGIPSQALVVLFPSIDCFIKNIRNKVKLKENLIQY